VFEQEADEIARHATGSTKSVTNTVDAHDHGIQRSLHAPSTAPSLPSIGGSAERPRDAGNPLDAHVRGRVEAFLGVDLSSV